MKNYILAAALIAGSITAFAQNVDKLINEDDVRKTITTLTADDMEGRGDFKPGLEKAARFIEQEFKSAGLKPLAGNKDYRQTFYMIRRTPGNIQATINGTAVAAGNVMVVADSSFNWKNAGDAEVAHITADQNFATEYRKYVTSGKKTLVLVDQKMEQGFKRAQMRAARGGVSLKAATGPQVVFILGDYENVQTIDINYQGKAEVLPLSNIAGVLPGQSKPDEFVVFGGHYDHLGIIKPMNGDSIANGADDDASGTTAVITLAKYYKKLHNNARSIIFVAFAAEELGSYGSTYFATQVDPQKVVAEFNIEMIGKPSRFGANTAYITGYERSDFAKILQKNIPETKFKFYPDPYTSENLFYRSDNASLARVGVPAHTISTDQIDIDEYYHKVTDELKTLNVGNITNIIKAIAQSSKSIVDGVDTPTRIPPASVN